MNEQHCIVWFRQDLRLQDNPALSSAASNGSILPVYIYDDMNSGQWQIGSASRWWLHHSLQSLNKTLDGNLKLFVGNPLRIIPRLITQTGIKSIVWNRCYEPWQVTRDKKLNKELILTSSRESLRVST